MMRLRSNQILQWLIFVPPVLIIRELNNDLWFLLTIGRYVEKSGFPTIEPFVLHENFSYVMQQWLSGYVFWLFYDHGGAGAVLVLTGLIYAIILLILFKLSMLLSSQNILLTLALTFLSAIGLYPFMVSRPYVFSTLVFVMEVYLLESFAHHKKSWPLMLLPVLSVGLINLHAAVWPFFFVLCLPWLIEGLVYKVLRKQPAGSQAVPLLPLLIAALLSWAAGWLNPYGSKAMTYLFRSYGHPEINAMVMEMKVIDPKSAAGIFFYGFIALSLFAYLADRRGQMRLRYVFLVSGLLILALSSARSFMWYAALAVFPLAFYLKHWTLKGSGTNSLRSQNIRRVSLILLLLLLIGEGTVLIIRPPDSNLRTRQLEAIFDQMPAPQASIAVRLYTGYDEGAYAEFKGYRPYLDARAEVFVIENNKKKDVMQEYYDLQTGKLHYRDFLDTYHFTHLILGPRDLLNVYLAHDSDYVLAAQEGSFKLYEAVR